MGGFVPLGPQNPMFKMAPQPLPWATLLLPEPCHWANRRRVFEGGGGGADAPTLGAGCLQTFPRSRHVNTGRETHLSWQTHSSMCTLADNYPTTTTTPAASGEQNARVGPPKRSNVHPRPSSFVNLPSHVSVLLDSMNLICGSKRDAVSCNWSWTLKLKTLHVFFIYSRKVKVKNVTDKTFLWKLLFNKRDFKSHLLLILLQLINSKDCVVLFFFSFYNKICLKFCRFCESPLSFPT